MNSPRVDEMFVRHTGDGFFYVAKPKRHRFLWFRWTTFPHALQITGGGKPWFPTFADAHRAMNEMRKPEAERVYPSVIA